MSQSKKKARARDAAAGISPIVFEEYPHYNHPGKKAFPRVTPKSVCLMSAGTPEEGPVYVNNKKGTKARRMLDQLRELIASGAKQCRIARLSRRLKREVKKLEN